MRRRPVLLLLLLALGCSPPTAVARRVDPPGPLASSSATPSAPPTPALGSAADGCADPPPCTTGCPKPLLGLTVGEGHACTLSAEGTLSCWGENAAGQLGDGTREPRPSPIEVARRVRGVAAGAGFTCLLEARGVRCLGAQARAWSTGRGATEDPEAKQPLALTPPITEAASIAAGGNDVCTLDGVGQATCFLYAEKGTPTFSIHGRDGLGKPVRVPGATALVEVAPGITSCGRTGAGKVLCWSRGEEAREVPGLSGVRSIAASFEEVCAVDSPDHVSCWAPSRPAQRTQRSVPGVVEVRAGGKGSLCARSGSGDVSCWGRLGDEWSRPAGGTLELAKPTPIRGTRGASLLSVGAGHACAATPDGVRCWGGSARGALGSGFVAEKPSPVEVALGAPAVDVAAHDFTTCAALADGRVRCWGRGYRSDPAAEGPATAFVRGLAGAETVAVGEQQGCAVAHGRVACWPNHPEGEAVAIAGMSDALAASPGINGGCAATRSGETRCWWPGREASVLPGVRDLVELHYVASDWSCGRERGGAMSCWSSPLSFPSPTWPTPQVIAIPNATRTLSVSKACAARTDGSVACLGGTFHNHAAVVVDGFSDVVEVTGGPSFLCARTRGGSIQCRSQGSVGELGGGSVGPAGLGASLALRFATVSGITDATSITSGLRHACAIRAGGAVWCWGDDTFGQVSGVASGLRMCARPVGR